MVCFPFSHSLFNIYLISKSVFVPSVIVSLLYPANARIITQVPFRPIRITTAGTSLAKIVGCPVLETSFATSKTYANKVIQVGIESRMREYGYVRIRSHGSNTTQNSGEFPRYVLFTRYSISGNSGISDVFHFRKTPELRRFRFPETPDSDVF